MCKSCGKMFNKLENQVVKHPNHFCSRSCSAKFNNKGKQRNPPKVRVCQKCAKEFVSTISTNNRSRTLCSGCYKSYADRREFLKSRKLSYYHDLKSVKGKHPSWKNSHIRILNRIWNANLLEQPCSSCGYSKHVELAHIKPISSFSDTATLGEVNAPENNRVLCPNCHWEFDHNLL